MKYNENVLLVLKLNKRYFENCWKPLPIVFGFFYYESQYLPFSSIFQNIFCSTDKSVIKRFRT